MRCILLRAAAGFPAAKMVRVHALAVQRLYRTAANLLFLFASAARIGCVVQHMFVRARRP